MKRYVTTLNKLIRQKTQSPVIEIVTLYTVLHISKQSLQQRLLNHIQSLSALAKFTFVLNTILFSRLLNFYCYPMMVDGLKNIKFLTSNLKSRLSIF